MIVAPSAAVPARIAPGFVATRQSSALDSADAAKMPAGSRSSAAFSKASSAAPSVARAAGIGEGRAVDAALQRMLAQHHLRLLGEVAVHLDAGRSGAAAVISHCRDRRAAAIRAVLVPRRCGWRPSVVSVSVTAHADTAWASEVITVDTVRAEDVGGPTVVSKMVPSVSDGTER